MYGVILHAHSVRGESHNQRNTIGEVATQHITIICKFAYVEEGNAFVEYH